MNDQKKELDIYWTETPQTHSTWNKIEFINVTSQIGQLALRQKLPWWKHSAGAPARQRLKAARGDNLGKLLVPFGEFTETKLPGKT